LIARKQEEILQIYTSFFFHVMLKRQAEQKAPILTQKKNEDGKKYSIVDKQLAAPIHTIIYYSLRPIILFANIDVSRHILVIDISVLAKSNMGRRE
jgi:hypothetical protein